MKKGTIKCNCGQTFYYETPHPSIECPRCTSIFLISQEKSPLAQAAQDILDIPTE